MLAILPVPVLTTHPAGVIRSVNASAATLFQLRVAEMVGKSALTMIAPEDLTDVRGLLEGLSRDGASFRRVMGVQGRDGELTSVELFASQLPGEPPEVVWMLLAGAPADRGPRSTAAVPEALTQIALLPTTVSDVQEVLNRAAVLCQESLGPTTSVSLSVGPPHAPTSVATTSQVAAGGRRCAAHGRRGSNPGRLRGDDHRREPRRTKRQAMAAVGRARSRHAAGRRLRAARGRRRSGGNPQRLRVRAHVAAAASRGLRAAGLHPGSRAVRSSASSRDRTARDRDQARPWSRGR